MSSWLASIDEVARRQYEQAWLNGRPDSIHRYLPAPDHPHYLPTLEELVHIEIEMSWKAWKAHDNPDGQPALPDLVEAYLERFPVLNQDAILHRLIEQECLARKQVQHRPRAEEYLQRFPHLTIKDALFSDNLEPPDKLSTNVTSSLSGKMLGRYYLSGEHSRGSFGIVWKADDLALGRSVALKQLKAYLCNRSEYRRRFLAEARITAQLQHPGIVPIHDVGGEAEGSPYYTMNMVAGETLAEAIEKYHADGTATHAEHAVEWQRLINAYLTVVRTMAFAHARNILHRDLKPANIILGQYGETLILDWGLAKVIEEGARSDSKPFHDEVPTSDANVTQPGSVIGTPAYMSPEQASGDTQLIGKHSDVYALGTILYELLTGLRPLQGDSAHIINQLILALPLQPPSHHRRGIPRALEAICMKALSHDPADRYAHADLLRADLELYLADEPVGAFAEPWWMRVGRWTRRHKALAAGAGVALLLLLIASIVSYFIWSAAVEKQQQEASDRIIRVRGNVETDEAAAELELKASRYSSTVHILNRAVRSLQGKPELIEAFEKMSARRDRLKRIAEFTRLVDHAEEHAAMDRDDASIVAAENALALVGVTEHLSDWWLHVPVDDLNAEQRNQIKEDVSRLLLLLGLQRAKLGVLTLFGGKDHFNKALLLIPAIQNYHQMQYGGPAQAGHILEQFCYRQLGHKERVKRLTNWQPRGPADHFYLGICHFYLGTISTNLQLTSIIPDSVARDLRSIGGLDLETPTETGLSLLRMAATLEPRRYWTYNWLGWCNLLKYDYEGAAQAFSTAVSLRPQQMFAYAERASVLLRKVYRLHYATLLQSLTLLNQGISQHPANWAASLNASIHFQKHQDEEKTQTLQRTLQGVTIGLKFDPHDDAMHFLQSRCLHWLQDHEQGLKAFGAGLVCTVPKESMAGDTYADFIHQAAGINELLKSWQPIVNPLKDADAWSSLALAYLRLGRLKDALTCVDHALIHAPASSRALAVRAHVHLKQNNLDTALIDLQKSGEGKPEDFLILAGLARYHELSQAWEPSLVHYQKLETIAKAPWQQVEASLGQARVLKQLGRIDEARNELKSIEEVAPRTINAAARKILPPIPVKTKS